jgi:hypothetical protein
MNRTEQSPLYGFLKFGRKQDLQEFRNDGLLYMRPLAEFAKLEESATGRGDDFEGITKIIQPKHVGKLIFDPGIAGLGKITVPPSDLAGPVRIRLNKTTSCDVYCMVALTIPTDLTIPADKALVGLVSSEVVGFGDSFVIVTNVTEFISRVVLTVKDEKNGVSYLESGLVDYYDAGEDSGEIGRFRKRSKFAYQNEFRIVVEPGSDAPRRLFVGSLLDITSEILPSSAALEPCRFTMDHTTA